MAGAYERPPGVGTDDPVGGEIARRLECDDCGGGARSEVSGPVRVRTDAERGQTILDVTDRLTLVTYSIEPHGPIVAHSDGWAFSNATSGAPQPRTAG